MTRYINKGKRTFNIKVNNNNVSWRPLEVYDLSKEEYELIKGFKEIEVLKEYSPVIDKEKEELKKLVKEQQEKIKELEKQLKKDSRNKEKKMEKQILINNIVITTQDFKDFFSKGEFKFLINWDVEVVYLINQEVYYNGLFYTSLINNNINNQPDLNLDKWEETEDNINTFINDNDIYKAFVEAKCNFNYKLFINDIELLKQVFLLLTAHYLVMDMNMLNGGYSNFLMTSKSVGSVSASYGIPQKILNNPLYNYFAGTSFGLKYLSYLYTRLIGNVFVVGGTTSPW